MIKIRIMCPISIFVFGSKSLDFLDSLEDSYLVLKTGLKREIRFSSEIKSSFCPLIRFWSCGNGWVQLWTKITRWCTKPAGGKKVLNNSSFLFKEKVTRQWTDGPCYENIPHNCFVLSSRTTYTKRQWQWTVTLNRSLFVSLLPPIGSCSLAEPSWLT